MNRKTGIFALLFALLTLTAVISGCSGTTLHRYEESREMMDTYIRVVVYEEDETSAQEAINAAYTRMEEISRIATSWEENGEAYRLNTTGHLDTASGELIEMINLSMEYSEITDGCFDITIQPVLDLWSYNPEVEMELQFWNLDEATQLEAIAEAKQYVGNDKITIDGNSITLAEGSAITLGGVAKGYAGDEALKTLSSMGIEHAFIDAGGDIKTLGAMPNGDKWNIALINPDDTTELLADFYVRDKAVTTSGNYERYYDPEKSAGHIMSPKTGLPVNDCISVTIIADSGIQADILATGVFVLGPEQGLELVESLDNVETMIIDSERNIIKSSGLSEYMK